MLDHSQPTISVAHQQLKTKQMQRHLCCRHPFRQLAHAALEDVFLSSLQFASRAAQVGCLAHTCTQRVGVCIKSCRPKLRQRVRSHAYNTTQDAVDRRFYHFASVCRELFPRTGVETVMFMRYS
jgi:hypothetical protein